MSMPDLSELLLLWLWIPISLLTIVICIGSGLHVYIDAHERFKSRGVAVCLALLVSFVYWPLSFVAYLLIIIRMEKQTASQNAASEA